MQNFLKLIDKSRKIILEKVENNEKDINLKNVLIKNDDVFPIEYLMNIPNRMKGHKFYQDVKIGDVIIGSITNVYKDYMDLTIMCTMGALIRDIYSLKITAICRSSELPIISNFCSIKAFRGGDKIKAIISKISKKDGIEISMNELSPMNKGKETDLGLISDEGLPSYFKIYRDGLKYPHFFNDIFSKNELSTPMDIKNKMDYFNISRDGFSLLDDVNRIHISPNESAKSMRNSLLLKESMKYVVKGVNFYKMKKLNEALQCYNHALSINEENVDALVARGALRASSKAFESSIEDLEKAVKIDPNHKNAATYLSQTIIAFSKSLPECDMTIAEDLVKRSILVHDDQLNKHLPNDIKDPNKFIVITDDETDQSSESSLSHRKRKNKRNKKHDHKEHRSSKKSIVINTSSDESCHKKHHVISINSSNDSRKSIKEERSRIKKRVRRGSSSEPRHFKLIVQDANQHTINEDIRSSKNYLSIDDKSRNRSSSTSSIYIRNKSKRNCMHVKESRKLINSKDSEEIKKDSIYRSHKISEKRTIVKYSSKSRCNSSSPENEFSHKHKSIMDKHYTKYIKSRHYSSESESQKLSKRFKNDSVEDDRRTKHISKRKSFIHKNLKTQRTYKHSTASIQLIKHGHEEDLKDSVNMPNLTGDQAEGNLKLKKANDDIKQIEDFISYLKQNE